jgi:hypothetical protein
MIKIVFVNLLKAISYKLKVNLSGQVMIITVLTLGGTILGVTTIAGLLMLYQIRQATDLASSAKAIFAADAGIEWSYYQFNCDPNDTTNKWPGCALDPPSFNPSSQPQPSFTNGASFEVTCQDYGGSKNFNCEDGKKNQIDGVLPEIYSIKSIGKAGNTSRAFLVTFFEP